MSALTFIHDLDCSDLPQAVQERLKLSLLDLIGVAAGGTTTRLSGIIRDMAAEDMPGNAPILFDHRTANPSAAAMASGMTIDALDGHDGFNPSKGHIGCSLFPTALTIGHLTKTSGRAFLATMAMGYEFGARAAMAQHGTCPDYHTSGAWGAVTAAAAAARLMGLDPDQTRHALGIAEYHGPRSQMMRCIDYPTMLKDGSGWGAMTGAAAVHLAREGFTGAPAITMEGADVAEFWGDIGSRWRIGEHAYILDAYLADPAAATAAYRLSQQFQSAQLAAHGHLHYWPREWCVSFKNQCVPRHVRSFVADPALPPGARIVVFAGNPKMSEVLAGGGQRWYRRIGNTDWLRQAWKGQP